MIPSPRLFARVFDVALCLLAASGVASAQGRRSKLDDALKAAEFGSSIQRVIVQTQPASRNALKETLTARGNVVIAEHDALSALTVELRSEELAALDENPSVLAVSLDPEVRAFAKTAYSAEPKPRTGDGLRVGPGLPAAPFTGAGIGIAVVDSGIGTWHDENLVWERRETTTWCGGRIELKTTTTVSGEP
jgi:choline dehydrogenase-like flavoprotein